MPKVTIWIEDDSGNVVKAEADVKVAAFQASPEVRDDREDNSPLTFVSFHNPAEVSLKMVPHTPESPGWFRMKFYG